MSTSKTGLTKLTLIGQYQTTYDGQSVAYTLRRSSRARLIWLNVKWQTGLTVTVPSRYDIGRLPDYLEKNWKWIQRNLSKYCENGPHCPQNSLQKDDSTIPYLGQSLILTCKESSCRVNSVKLECNRLIVDQNPLRGGILSQELELWYRQQATSLIQEKVRQISTRMGLTYNRIVIRGQRTRWGSCSCQRNLNFNWRIIMAPETVIDYVIIHELSHLKQMNHSPEFWQLVGQFCPRWPEYRQWLNKHTADLNTVLPFRNMADNRPGLL